MAVDVGPYISEASSRASSFASMASSAISSIGSSTGSRGYTTFNLESLTTSSSYSPPSADTTPRPVYETPTTAVPSAPSITDITAGVVKPVLPVSPTLNTSGLFGQVVPTSTMPEWNEVSPNLHVDEIYNELIALAMPAFADINLPAISPISTGTAPTLQLPVYEAYATPEAIAAPVDYGSFMQAKYDKALPEMQGFIDDIVDGWIQKFAPEYYSQRDLLNDKLTAGMNGGVLPDQFETAMYSRARARSEDEYSKTEKQTMYNSEKRGFLIPPGAVTSALNKARLEGVKSLAGQSTDIYIERRKAEVQHLQYVLQIASVQLQNVRSIAMQYAQVGVSIIDKAQSIASEITNKIMTLFEHERSRHAFALEIMKVVNDQYETKLKAALAGLEGFKVNLEALRLQKDVEFKQLEGARLQIEAQQLLVQRYSAMVEAIAKQASVAELKVKEYEVRAEVFQSQVKAKVASFEVYKAAVEGDKGKLDGEMAKLSIYEGQLKAASIATEIEAKVLDANAKTNEAKLGQYNAQLEGYKIASTVALQKFTTQAELKKLGLETYKTNVEANVEVYKANVSKDLALLEAKVSAFKGNVESLSNFYQLERGYSELNMRKSEAIATGYSNMAAAALQSLSATVSQAA